MSKALELVNLWTALPQECENLLEILRTGDQMAEELRRLATVEQERDDLAARLASVRKLLQEGEPAAYIAASGVALYHNEPSAGDLWGLHPLFKQADLLARLGEETQDQAGKAHDAIC